MNPGDRNLPTTDAAHGVPATRRRRDALRAKVRRYVQSHAPERPTTQAELVAECERMASKIAADADELGFLAVLLHNELWADAVAAVPFKRRLLLLPQCLRAQDRCHGRIDSFGLVCAHCGACPIGELHTEATRLGYAVLAAEGMPVVMSLVQSGRIDAMFGVCCMESLEKVFPRVMAADLPAVAVPLLGNGCRNTHCDLRWVRDVMHLRSQQGGAGGDLTTRRGRVLDLFNPERLEEILGPAEGETDEIARRFLCLAGKRWRPLLCAYAWQAFSQTDTNAPLPPAVAAAAVAVECFHKASLVHDDIEDGDVERYGRATLHVEHGVPVALNCGDLLLGEGYRLLSACDAPADLRAAMAATAAAGHRQLCRGQGAELCWTRSPTPLTVEQVVEVFAYKTAAAFEVALRIGAILSGVRDAATHDALARYSQALGVAYQIRDDLADFAGDGDGLAGRPSLLFALAWRDADGARRKRLRGLADANRAESNDAVALVRQLGEAPAQRMFQAYKERAIQAAHTLKSPRARELLTRLVSQIFTGP